MTLPDMSEKKQSKKTKNQPPKQEENQKADDLKAEAGAQPLTGEEEQDAPPVDALERAGLAPLEAEPVDDEPQAAEFDADGNIYINGEAFLTKDAFYDLFVQAHVIGGLLLQLQTLLNVGELQETRAASDELYGLILEMEYLHFLIKPGSKYFRMVSVFGAYAFAVVPPVMAEIKQKKRAKAEAQKAAEEVVQEEAAA